jgi:outer membrane receptor for monomeric catechols
MNPIPTTRLLLRSATASFVLLAAGTASAQAVAPVSNPAPANDETVVLSPFVVNAEQDTGYAASSTLAGSRFKTDLKDTAASISVLTSDFISDLGANSIQEALLYSVNAQLDVAAAGADGTTPNGNGYQSGPAEFIVRGQPSTRARNYFTLRLQTDNYNVERIEESRGPNSVLFGFGAPGGILNASTKQARLDRQFAKAGLQTGSFSSHRETLDVNQVLMKGKLALRLNAVNEQSNKFQEYAFNHDRRFDLTATYQVTPTLQIRAEYERSLINENKPRPFTLADGGMLLWQQLGSQTYAAPIATNAALSITRLGSARRLTYVGNNNSIIETGSTNSTLDPAAIELDEILDPAIASPTINYGGPAQLTTWESNGVSVFLEKRLGSRTFLELAFNHQDEVRLNFNPGQTNFKIFGDPNQRLRNSTAATTDDPANPYVGQLYMETTTNSWERNKTRNSSDLGRVTLSTEYDAGKWGNYRLAALGEYDSRIDFNDNQREVWAGRPFNSAPENAANQVKRRTYVTPGDWKTYFINGALTTGLIKGAVDPITGRILDSTWVARSQSQEDDPATQKSALVAGQARYFNSRLVLGAGWRYDKLEILDRTAQRDPVTNEWSHAFATEGLVEQEARNTSLGAVYHATDNISVHYNRANNQGLQGSVRIININDLNGPVVPAPSSEGQGQDIGVTVRMFDGKINLRAVHYTTDAVNLSDSFSPTAVGPDKVSANIMNTLRTAGLVTQAVADAHTVTSNGLVYGQASKGYEFNLTANLSKNWRLQANYSYTDTHFSNYGVELAAWMDQEIAYWRSFNQGSRVTGDGRTIEEAIAFMVAGFGNQANLANIGEPGLRKHKVSFFTRYDLPGDKLKGAYVGGGYRYQSKNLAGTNAGNTVGFYGPSYWRADLLAGYKFRKAATKHLGGFVDGLSLQLNVTNVFDDHDPLITRIQPDGVSITRALVQEPRMWRLQANLEF